MTQELLTFTGLPVNKGLLRRGVGRRKASLCASPRAARRLFDSAKESPLRHGEKGAADEVPRTVGAASTCSRATCSARGDEGGKHLDCKHECWHHEGAPGS